MKGMSSAPPLKVSILTAGRDPYYALGLLSGLVGSPIRIDFIGNTGMGQAPAAHAGNVRYWNLYPDQPAGAPAWRKLAGVVGQYLSLLRYGVTTDSSLFHILWYNKLEWFDNTVLLLFYKALRKRVVFTVHNVNRKERDGQHDLVNRWSLKFLYRQVDHIFAHTRQAKAQIINDFGVSDEKITVIPFGVNSFTFQTSLTPAGARKRLGIAPAEKVLLFFGNIAPYKGLDLLVDALAETSGRRLIIAGPIKKGCDSYWRQVEDAIRSKGLTERVIKEIKFVPDEDVEIYFKAADVTILPYKTVSQSGVLFLSYNFGVPVIATGVGGLAESIEEGETGFVCRPDDAADLAAKIDQYFQSKLFEELEARRKSIVREVSRRHSWDNIGRETCRVYARVARSDSATASLCGNSEAGKER